MDDLNFVIMGDEKFFDSILLSMKQTQKYYPEARLFVYDWGFKREQVVQLTEEIGNVHIIDWKNIFNSVRAIHVITVQYWFKQFIKKYLYFKEESKYSLYEKVSKFKMHEYLLMQKPFCILDCAQRVNGKMIFLDGDVILVNKIDELLDDNFDVGVTLRRMHEIRYRRNECKVLNSGVIVFNGTNDKTISFINKWIQTMKFTYECLIEQTALTRMIGKENPEIYNKYYQTGVVNASGKSVVVKVFPCEVFNFNWIEEGVDKSKNKIVHFKGGRHDDAQFIKFIEKLDL